jgi:glycosyltransferase involved in cell wall biosynthesis
MAKPVVAAAFDDAQRLLHANQSGYLYSPGDPEDLRQVLRRAYAERHLWEEKGRRGRQEVVASHSWKARISAVLPAVEHILTEKYGTPFPARGGRKPSAAA